ncbi:MAG: DUF1080 domain-containing protein [Verrucomicrobiota bacterium]
MKRRFCLGLLLLAAKSLAAEEVPAFLGDWEGGFLDPPRESEWALNPSLVAQVVGLGEGQYEVQLLNVFERRAHPYVRARTRSIEGALSVEQAGWKFRITADSFVGSKQVKEEDQERELPFSLAKVVRPSPTLGQEAPLGGEVLLGEGGGLEKWWHGEGQAPTWRVLPGGVVEVLPRGEENPEGGDLLTRKSFRDCAVHLEFRLPYSPDRRGQKRNNSGLFFPGGYEVQILDSYGFEAGWTECGSLYRVSPPKVNRSRPPGEWQTYEVTFRSAVYDEEGELRAAPVMTVDHNGERIHLEQELFEITQFREVNRKKPHPEGPGPLKLQDHGDRVQFRNFWVQELPVRDFE